MLHREDGFRAGGNTVSPILSIVGSMNATKSRRPCFALFRSVQLGSLAPLDVWHIEPVRSSTSMMSSGRIAQGAQAVDFTLMLK